METNANLRPNSSKKHFDFEAFDSEITRELKESSMFYDPDIDGVPKHPAPGEIGGVAIHAEILEDL